MGSIEKSITFRKVKGATVIHVTPEVIIAKKGQEDLDMGGNSIGVKAFKVKVQVSEGGPMLPYGLWEASSLPSEVGNYIIANALSWKSEVSSDKKTFEYTLYLSKDASVSMNIPFTVTCKGIVYNRIIQFVTLADGGSSSDDDSEGGADGSGGGTGTGIVRKLDLDNENDSFVYDNEGNCKSGDVKTTATLYINGIPQYEGVAWSYSQSGINDSNTNYITQEDNIVKVSGMKEKSGTVTIKATYEGNIYAGVFSLKKLINASKYSIIPSVNNITYNLNDGDVTKTIIFEIYTIDVNGVSSTLKALPTNFTLKYMLDNEVEKDITNMQFVWSTQEDHQEYRNLRVTLRAANGGYLDSENIPIMVYQDGISPEAFFRSTVFTRMDPSYSGEIPLTPKGGTYNNPLPTTNKASENPSRIWTDGIPSGNELLWASYYMFGSETDKVDQNKEWSTPEIMVDNPSFDVAFSSNKERPADPISHGNHEGDPNWKNVGYETTIWMATSTKTNGIWSPWSVINIKGEKGNDGTSINIKKGAKIVPTYNDLLQISNPVEGDECFVGDVNDMKYVKLWIYRNGEWIEKPKEEITTGDAYLVDEWLFVWDGDSWVKSQFKGDNGKSAYIHIKYGNSSTAGDWTNRGNASIAIQIPSGLEAVWGETPGAYIGIIADNISDDPTSWSDYNWSKWEGQDGFGYEYIFTRTEDYVAPDVPTPEDDDEKEEWATTDEIHPDPWSDDNIGVTEDHKYCWVCYRMKKNGRWSDFQGTGSNKLKAALYAKWASDGIGKDANNAFKSTVFTKAYTQPDTPSPLAINGYNEYGNPIPPPNEGDGCVWTDGTPDSSTKPFALLWMSTRIFSNDGESPQEDSWSAPFSLSDSANFDVEFSRQENPDKPEQLKEGETTDNAWHERNSHWEEDAGEDTIWMATATCYNGIWEDWKVSKIKGEKGDDGTSIKVMGHYADLDAFKADFWDSENNKWIAPENLSDCYVVGTDLYVWDGSDEWINVGPFKGDKGDSAYIHIKYANQDDTSGKEVTLVDGTKVKLSFTENSGKDPGLYMGIKANYTSTPPSDISDYTWTRWRGEDGFGYEYIYCRTQGNNAPDIPTKEIYEWTDEAYQENDFVPTDPTGNLVWTDNPQDVNEDYPYCWMCHRQKVDGVWQDFKGSATNEGFASVWTRWGHDGEGIASITRKYQVSNSTNKEDVINGTWSDDSPAVEKETPYLWEWIHTTYTSGGYDDDYAIIGRMGESGIDGKYNEYIYCLTKDNSEPNTPSGNVVNNTALGIWTDDPKSVSEIWPYQWISEREYDPSEKKWGDYSTPVLWNIWSKGENSIHLDLDNEMDSMLYSDNNELISSDVVTNPTLYDGSTPVLVKDILWELDIQDSEEDNYTFDYSSGILTVTGISANQNTVIYSIIANYKNAKYVSSLTIKKLVGVDKYDLVIIPNSFTYNTTTTTSSQLDGEIKVYRTNQKGERTLVDKLENYGLSLEFENLRGSYPGGYDNGLSFDPDFDKDYVLVQLLKDNVVVDSETISINKSKDGDKGEDSINIMVSPENTVLKQGVGNATGNDGVEYNIIKVGIQFTVGGVPLLYSSDIWTCGILSSDDYVEGMYWEFETSEDGLTFYYILYKAKEDVVNTEIPFNVTYKKNGNVYTYYRSFSITTIADGDSSEHYEIVPTNAYYMVDPNIDGNNVNMLVQGYLYKIVGRERIPVDNEIIKGRYFNSIQSTYDFETDSEGYFSIGGSSDDWDSSEDAWADANVNESKSYVVWYEVDGVTVASYSVGVSMTGLNGRGKASAPIRVSIWSEDTNWTYFSGNEDGDKYTDIVIYNGSYYRCIKSHSTSQTPTNTTYWESAEEFSFVATDLLLAENARINLLTGNTIEATDGLGNVGAGMSGFKFTDDYSMPNSSKEIVYPFWAGADFDNRNTAPFRIELQKYKDAYGNVQKTTDIYLEGVVTAKALYRGVKVVYPTFFPVSINGTVYDIAQSNSNPDNPTYEDFIFIKDAFESTDNLWDYAQDDNRYPINEDGTYVDATYNPTDCGNIFLPNPDTKNLEGKEVTIINNTNPVAAELMVYTAPGSIDSFYNPYGDGDCESISLAGLKKVHLVAGRFLIEKIQWIVLDVETRE